VSGVLRFGEFELEPATRELHGPAGPIHLEQQVFDVLLHLVEHRDRVVLKTELLDEIWGDRFVSESALTSRIKSARQAVGDSGGQQQVIRTVRGVGYRFVAEVRTDVEPRGVLAPFAVPVDGEGSETTPACIWFVESAGCSLAVAETGAGRCLVKTATWLTQVDKDTDASPIWGHWVRALSRRFHYVRYDPPGCGLSDRDLRGRDLTDLGQWVDDLGRVIDAVDEERVALLGISQGGPVAVAYAVRYPERVSHLVLYGTYARGMTRRNDPVQAEEAALQVGLARIGWGTRNATFRETFARQFVPDAQSEEIAWFNDQLQLTTNSTNAPLLESAFHSLDVSDLARKVRVPTLVLHAVDDRGVPFEEGRHLAGLIPGARFVALNSRNHILLQRDAAFARFVDEVDGFLSEDQR
jgi:pimeloyl-ACP methyl ester carboxylesterase/DNA-binding winged helix-turn-helix (wHTH) protein